MKSIKPILFLILLIPLTTVSQNNNIEVLPHSVSKIFLLGDCAEVLMSKSSNYLAWNHSQKVELVKVVSSQKHVSRVVIRFNYTREIWTVRGDVIAMVSSVDIEDFDPLREERYTDQVYTKCDFFTYYGMAMDFNLSHLTTSFSGRTGCFFFKQFWDLSVNYSYTLSIQDVLNTSSISIGLMTKFYPFFKATAFVKHRVSPYIGIDGGYYATFEEGKRTDSWDLNGHVGVSWQVGPGSLDFGMQSSRQNLFAATIGYSFCPAMLSHNKNRQK